MKKAKKRKHRLRDYFALFTIIIIVLAIPVTVILSQQTATFQQHASYITNILYTSGTNLALNGVSLQMDGVNAYEFATDNGYNAGCGPQISNPDTFFSGLRPNSLVRIWAFQSLATNPSTKQIDWTGLDRVVNSATKYNQKLVLSIGNQWTDCHENIYKTLSWYQTGYQQVQNPSGYTPLSYYAYAQKLVTHYKGNTTIGMWELINEPEAKDSTSGTCEETNAANALRSFFDTVGGKIKSIDPNHLIETGFIGTGQCGSSGNDYQYIHKSSHVDIASYHDYGADTTGLPGNLSTRLNQMASIGKPLIVGEVGIKAQNNLSGCINFSTRNSEMKNKMNAQYHAGIAAFIPWDYMPSNSGICAYETITSSDPLMSLLHSYPLKNN